MKTFSRIIPEEMDWMRCNCCWLKVASKMSMFHLTQCGHFYCSNCIVKAEQKCFQCGTEQVGSLPAEESTSPQISHYFIKPSDLLEKVSQAQQFQEDQMFLCLQKAATNESKYQSLKEAYFVSAENLKKLHEKYSKVKMALAALHKENKVLTTANNSITPNTYRTNQYRANQITPPASCKYRTPPNQIKNSKCNESFVQACYAPKQDNQRKCDGIFRIPAATKVPRSIGYYSGSSTCSNSSYCSSSSTPKSITPNYRRY